MQTKGAVSISRVVVIPDATPMGITMHVGVSASIAGPSIRGARTVPCGTLGTTIVNVNQKRLFQTVQRSGEVIGLVLTTQA